MAEPADVTTTAPEPELLSAIIPEALHDRAYLKDFLEKPQNKESFAEVFNKLDNSQALLGKKSILPSEDDTAGWDELLTKMRPETADGYVIDAKEGADPDFLKQLKQSFHDAGLSKQQANKMQGSWLETVEKQNAVANAAKKELDDAFNILTAETFGKDNEEVLARVNAALKEHTPQNLRPHLEKLSNESTTILAGVVNAILTKYVPEDKLTKTPADSISAVDVSTEGRRLMALPEYKDFNHPLYEETNRKVRELYASLNKK